MHDLIVLPLLVYAGCAYRSATGIQGSAIQSRGPIRPTETNVPIEVGLDVGEGSIDALGVIQVAALTDPYRARELGVVLPAGDLACEIGGNRLDRTVDVGRSRDQSVLTWTGVRPPPREQLPRVLRCLWVEGRLLPGAAVDLDLDFLEGGAVGKAEAEDLVTAAFPTHPDDGGGQSDAGDHSFQEPS